MRSCSQSPVEPFLSGAQLHRSRWNASSGARWPRRPVPAILLPRRGGACPPCRLARSTAASEPQSCSEGPQPPVAQRWSRAPWPDVSRFLDAQPCGRWLPMRSANDRRLSRQLGKFCESLSGRIHPQHNLWAPRKSLRSNPFPFGGDRSQPASTQGEDGPAMTESYLTAWACSAWSFPQTSQLSSPVMVPKEHSKVT